jgi:uncharacterized protein (TIGR02145 family)
MAKIPVKATPKKTVKTAEKKKIAKSTAKVKPIPKVNANKTAIDEIKIGEQIWTNKNLDVLTYRNGDEIPQIQDKKEWAKLTTGAWCYYDNNTKNGAIYGKLYNWFALNDKRGLAPEGYHIPSHEEWDTLLANLGGDFCAGGKMKEKGTKNWNNPNEKATNKSEYTALPGGYRSASGDFYGILEKASYWSISEFNNLLAKERSLMNSTNSVILSYREKGQGSTIRCIKDNIELIKGMKVGNLEVFKNDIGELSFNDAKLECEKIGGGWRVPTKDELNQLYENKEIIGQFTDGFYWSSTKDESSISFGWGQRFEDGFQNICSTTSKFRNFIRPVRSLK